MSKYPLVQSKLWMSCWGVIVDYLSHICRIIFLSPFSRAVYGLWCCRVIIGLRPIIPSIFLILNKYKFFNRIFFERSSNVLVVRIPGYGAAVHVPHNNKLWCTSLRDVGIVHFGHMQLHVRKLIPFPGENWRTSVLWLYRI